MIVKNDLYIKVEPYTEILGGLSFVLSISNGVVKLTGKTGTGKTAMCIELLHELKTEKIQFVHFPDVPENFEAVVEAIKEKLSLSPKNISDKDSFIQALTAYIIKKSFDEQRLVLIFDDAENLSSELLGELIAFRHIHLNDQGLVSIVLSGTSDMDKKLSNGASALVSDLLVSYTLEPMNREQLAAFCEAYLEQIKVDAKLTDENISQLLEMSEGLPGEIPNLLPQILDQDESKVYVRKKKQKELVTKASKTIQNEFIAPLADKETQKEVIKRWRKWHLGPAIIAAGLAVGLFITYAAYVFLPEDIIPLTVSYFNDEVADEVVAEVPVQQPAVPAPEEQVPATVPEEQPAVDEDAEIIADTETPVQEPEPAVSTETVEEPQLVLEEEPALQPEGAPAEQPVVLAPEPEPEPEPEAEEQLAAEETAGAGFEVTATDEIQRAVEEWLQAWQAQDVDAYFGSYHEEFEPRSFASLTSWRNQRERNILRPSAISISYDDYMVQSRSDNSTMLTMRMEYRSPTYADRTLKQLGLIQDAEGEWKIAFEENIQVERLPVDWPIGQPTGRLPVYLVPQISASPAVPADSDSPGASVVNLNTEQERLFNFVNNWLVAWQNQDVNAYFDYYQSNYRGFNFTSPQAWEQDRQLKISRPSYIELRMSDFEVLMESGNDSLVQFSLEYRSPYYADRTLKQVLLRRGSDGSLRISNELNRQVELLPIYRRVNNVITSIF